jgi:hypothetical protein
LIEKPSAHRKSSRRISRKSESLPLRSGEVFQQTASAFLRSSDTQPEEKFVHRAICFLAEFGMTFVGGVVRAPNIDDWAPVVLRSSTAEQHCDRVIDQAADLKPS